MTEEQREFAREIGEHNAEWLREFKQLVEVIKSCTPQQIDEVIRILNSLKG